MGDVTKIEWADRTFNPWEGCQKVGPGCDNCYAETRNARYGGGVAPNWGPGAPRRRTSTSNWAKPRRWDREAAASGQRVFVFCASLADVFDNAVPPEWRADLFQLIRDTPNLTWLLLTKRIGNVISMVADMAGPHQDVGVWWPRNAALGATMVTQLEINRDMGKLAACRASPAPAFTFLSMEPLLEHVHLGPLLRHTPRVADWVIVGGESGPGARPMAEDWALNVLVDVKAFNNTRPYGASPVVFNFKQMGGAGPDKGGHRLIGQEFLDRPASQ